MNIRLPKVGDRVNVIEKRDYESGKLTTGIVRRTLSNPHEAHPRGNKVELEDGTVGRLVSFVDEVGVQKWVDPAQREEYAREIRDQRSDNRGSGMPDQRSRSSEGFQGTRPPGQMSGHRPSGEGYKGPQRDFPNRPDRFDARDRRGGGPPPPEPPVRPSDLPGEDDLR